MNTPQASGMWKRRLSAIAVPITSARSQAAMAISQSTHRPNPIGFNSDRDSLCQVAARDDAQLAGEPLQQDRHQVGDEDDAQER